LESPNVPVPFTVERDGKTLALSVTPVMVPKYEISDAGVYPQVLPNISQVNPDSPALAAGFREGDELRAVDGRVLATDMDFVNYIGAHAGVRGVVTVRRGDSLVDVRVTPRDVGAGNGRIGVSLTTAVQLPPL